MGRWERLITAFAAVLVALAGGALVARGPALPLAVGLGVALLTEMLLIWREVAVRSVREPAIAYARPPWLQSGLALLALAATALAQASNADAPERFALPFLGLLAWAAYIPATVSIWIADAEGLRRRRLMFSKMLPWSAIDWVYPSRQRARAGVTVQPITAWVGQTLLVEAGPRRRIVVPLGEPVVDGQARALLAAIVERATGAELGLDRLPQVHERRTAGGDAASGILSASRSRSTPIPTGRDDLAGAVLQVRAGLAPPQWGVFRVRPWAVAVTMLAYVVVGALAIVAGWHLYSTGTVLGAQYLPASWTSGTGAQTAELVELGLGDVVGLVLAGIGLSLLPRLSRYADCFFIATHSGFAEVKGGRVRGALFGGVRSLSYSGGGVFGPRIIVILNSGHRIVYDLGRMYGPPRDVYAYLLASYNALSLQRYRRTTGRPRVTQH